MSPTPPPYSKFFTRNETCTNDGSSPTEQSSLLSSQRSVQYNATIDLPQPPPVQGNNPRPRLGIGLWIWPYLLMIMLPNFIVFSPFIPSYIRDIRRNQAGVTWGFPTEGPCVQYGSRGYSAKLLNYAVDRYWTEACTETRMVINGQKMESPLRCEVAGDEVIGYWKIDNGDTTCRPFWGSIKDEYCVGSDKMLSLPLIHVQNDSHWETVCKTTPFHSDNNTYFPMECENKGVDGVLVHLQLERDQGCMKRERIQIRREAGVSWSVPQPGSCLRYAARAYSTILLKYSYDDYWQEACETTELLFDGRNLTSPAKCELVWDQSEGYKVAGYWEIMEYSPECTPYWVSISNEHCVGTNKRMVSAQLWNIRDPKIWDRMCRTAPLTLQGVSRVPSSCENKGASGIWGHWEIHDHTCAMFS